VTRLDDRDVVCPERGSERGLVVRARGLVARLAGVHTLDCPAEAFGCAGGDWMVCLDRPAAVRGSGRSSIAYTHLSGRVPPGQGALAATRRDDVFVATNAA